jgi:hypothetical protein
MIMNDELDCMGFGVIQFLQLQLLHMEASKW